MGRAKEDQPESSSLEGCCCGPLFHEESRGISQSKSSLYFRPFEGLPPNLKPVHSVTLSSHGDHDDDGDRGDNGDNDVVQHTSV